jgi:hypothetical protein
MVLYISVLRFQVITNNLSDYITLLVRIAHIIYIHPIFWTEWQQAFPEFGLLNIWTIQCFLIIVNTVE